ncbi:MAG: coproporphyrinogen dehydrogenase HemZ, partial [Oscillospiraceae bacterium]
DIGGKKMTVIFSGNDYKYEIEGILKLFFPAANFTFLYDEKNCDDDFCVIRRKTLANKTYFFVRVKLGEKYARMAENCENSQDNYDNFCEQTLCKLLFFCLKKLTKISPSWGILTGIRPVKRVNKLIDEGKNKAEISEILSKNFFVEPRKIELSYATAITQKPLLKINPRSFSLYVSIPFCPSRCSYCSFVSHSIESAKKLIPKYVETLCEEIKITAEIAEKLGLSIDTIYFGGGTPTSIDAEFLAKIMEAVRKNFNLSTLREYTVEAGRPDTINAEKLGVIRDFGAKRISINPQTMNDDVLREIGRKHTAEQCKNSFALARKMGFNNINMDLIAGLPTETVNSFKNSVDEIIQLAPENITVHTLSLKRSSTLFRDLSAVDGNPVGEMVEYSNFKIMGNHYNPYYLYRQKNTLGNQENVGYSKNGCESLYNIFIMEEIQTILAVGAAASTKLVNPFTGGISRVYNYKYPYEYIERFNILSERKNEILNFYNNIKFL